MKKNEYQELIIKIIKNIVNQMFQPKLLRSALVALAVVEMITKADTSSQDIADYPDFAASMTMEGSLYSWKAVSLDSVSGYNLKMFRVTEDDTGAPLTDTLGPILLLHGMFSDPMDWLKRKDEQLPALPIQLAQMGYDVWIGCTRGRPHTDTHSTLDLANPVDKEAFWNFSYEQIGSDDVESMLAKIIEERIDRACSKVTLVTHGTGANSSLAAASLNPDVWSSKVSKIINLAPCLQVDVGNFWLPVRDLQSIDAFYSILNLSGVRDFFGPGMVEDVAPFCAAGPQQQAICDFYIYPNVGNPKYRQSGLLEIKNVHRNGSMGRFESLGESAMEYPLQNIIDIPIYAMMSDQDSLCPSSMNLDKFGFVEGFSHDNF